MAADEIAGLIRSQLEERGYRGGTLPVAHVAQLKHEIEGRLSRKEMDAALYEKYGTYLKSDVAAGLPRARSVVITAAPQPQRKVSFHFNDQTYSAIIPPTYYADTDDQIGDILENILNAAPLAISFTGLLCHLSCWQYGADWQSMGRTTSLTWRVWEASLGSEPLCRTCRPIQVSGWNHRQ